MKHEIFDQDSSDPLTCAAPPADPRPVACACKRDVAKDEMVRALIAKELDAIRELLEEVGVDLCGHPVIVQEYSRALQGIDELAQRNENLARVLRASAMESAIDGISLESLRVRLLDGVTDYFADRANEPPSGALDDWTSI